MTIEIYPHAPSKIINNTEYDLIFFKAPIFPKRKSVDLFIIPKNSTMILEVPIINLSYRMEKK